MEDALISPVSFAALSGAGVIKQNNATPMVHVHTTTKTTIGAEHKVELKEALGNDILCFDAPIFVMGVDTDGSLTGELYELAEGENSQTIDETGAVTEPKTAITLISGEAGTTVQVDYYVLKKGNKVTELQIDAENFGGYFYVEGDTLWRDKDGKDYPAVFTFPKVKIQSNFTFTMASTGDPSTFSFTMDAFPGYTYFDKTREVLCVIQVVEESDQATKEFESVMDHATGETTTYQTDPKNNGTHPEKKTV